MEQELGRVGRGNKNYETGFWNHPPQWSLTIFSPRTTLIALQKWRCVPERLVMSFFPGSRKLREAEKTAAEPRGCQQSAEEGGEGGEEEEGWVWLGGKFKVELSYSVISDNGKSCCILYILTWKMIMTCRASTPVGDRVGVNSRPAKRSLADDERSNSSRWKLFFLSHFMNSSVALSWLWLISGTTTQATLHPPHPLLSQLRYEIFYVGRIFVVLSCMYAWN